MIGETNNDQYRLKAGENPFLLLPMSTTSTNQRNRHPLIEIREMNQMNEVVNNLYSEVVMMMVMCICCVAYLCWSERVRVELEMLRIT